ncbi:uncharacterized protein [Miscanthus floridulus]|uniref:uncharacterized protein n=1 Tax=Miscanthus floridulus TaxID=154761 RepID=UPI003459AFE6
MWAGSWTTILMASHNFFPFIFVMCCTGVVETPLWRTFLVIWLLLLALRICSVVQFRQSRVPRKLVVVVNTKDHTGFVRHCLVTRKFAATLANQPTISHLNSF